MIMFFNGLTCTCFASENTGDSDATHSSPVVQGIDIVSVVEVEERLVIIVGTILLA